MYRSAHSGGINDKKKHVYRQCLYMTIILFSKTFLQDKVCTFLYQIYSRKLILLAYNTAPLGVELCEYSEQNWIIY